MKLKSSYEIKNQGDEFIVFLPENTELRPLRLSKYGAFLFECTKKESLTSAQMLDKLLNSFEISTVLALGEIDTFIKKCKENNIFE